MVADGNSAIAAGKRGHVAAGQLESDAAVEMPASTSRSVLMWVKVAVRWRKLVAGTALAVVVLGGSAALLLPNRYTATVVLLPPQQGSSAGSAMMSQMSMAAAAMAPAGLSLKNPNDQQIALLKSRTVEDAMVERFHLQQLYHKKYISTARTKWEKKTAAENGLKDGLIRISVTDNDPQRAAAMANAWVDEYRAFSATLAVTEAQQRRLFYERELNAAHDELTQAEQAMQQTELRTGVIDLEGQDRSMIASAAILRGQLAAKEIEIKAMREFAAPGNPDLQRADEEASGMEAQLAAMDADADRRSGDLIAPRGKVTQAGLDYARALREVKYRETLQDLLTRQYEGARVDEAREGPMIQVVDPAAPPDRPNSQYRIWIFIAALVFAFPVGLLVAAGAEIAAILCRARQRCGSWIGALEEVASQ
jgi:tyrosine-protein kinase Etk/Wzc